MIDYPLVGNGWELCKRPAPRWALTPCAKNGKEVICHKCVAVSENRCLWVKHLLKLEELL